MKAIVVVMLMMGCSSSRMSDLPACAPSAPSWSGVWQCQASKDPAHVKPCVHVGCTAVRR